MSDKSIDTDNTDDPVCPYCGIPDPDWWDGLEPGKGDGSAWEAECGFCDQSYTVTMHESITFTTEKPEAVQPKGE